MGTWRVWAGAVVFCVLGGLAHAQVESVGSYTPSALGKAGESGAKAVLLHAVAGFCSKCEEQRQRLSEMYPMYPGVERHVVVVDVPMETWGGEKTLAGFGLTEPGQLVLVRGSEVLAFVETAAPEDIATLFDAVFAQPDWAPVVPPTPPAAPLP